MRFGSPPTVKRSFESLGQDEDLIWQAYQNGELIDEEMVGVYPEKVNRL